MRVVAAQCMKSGFTTRNPEHSRPTRELENRLNPVPNPETKTITSYSGVELVRQVKRHFDLRITRICLREVKKEYDDSLKQFIRTITLYNHKKVSSVTIDTLKEKVE